MQNQRTIGDIAHPQIKYAEELLIWYYREQRFILCGRHDYPLSRSCYCKLCPPYHNRQIKYQRTIGDNCKTKVRQAIGSVIGSVIGSGLVIT